MGKNSIHRVTQKHGILFRTRQTIECVSHNVAVDGIIAPDDISSQAGHVDPAFQPSRTIDR